MGEHEEKTIWTKDRHNNVTISVKCGNDKAKKKVNNQARKTEESDKMTARGPVRD